MNDQYNSAISARKDLIEAVTKRIDDAILKSIRPRAEARRQQTRAIAKGIDDIIKVALDDYFAGLPWSLRDLVGRMESKYYREDKRTVIMLDGIPLVAYYEPEFTCCDFDTTITIKCEFLLNKALTL